MQKRYLTLKWYAVHTRARWEKKVIYLLNNQGFESYCPLVKSKRRWSDRVKIIEEPLMKGCIFVKACEDQRSIVRMTNGVINFIYKEGKPVVVKEKDIILLKKFIADQTTVELVTNVEANNLELERSKKSAFSIIGHTIVAKQNNISALTNETV